MSVTSFSTVGQPVLEDGEVIWDGAIDHAWATAQQRPAPREARDGPTLRSGFDNRPRTDQSGFVGYLRAHPDACHDSQSVAMALNVTQGIASQWLLRAHRRGLVRPHTVITRGGRPATVYRVVQEMRGNG